MISFITIYSYFNYYIYIITTLSTISNWYPYLYQFYVLNIALFFHILYNSIIFSQFISFVHIMFIHLSYPFQNMLYISSSHFVNFLIYIFSLYIILNIILHHYSLYCIIISHYSLLYRINAVYVAMFIIITFTSFITQIIYPPLF